MSAVSSILVIGAGQAAAVAVATLRDQGYQGRITVVGDEAHAPYERPPLSKAVLAAVEAEEPGISVKEEDFFSARDIDLRLGTEVVSLNPAAGQALLSDGSAVAYDRCLLATGGTARQLPELSPDAPQVHYLRTLDDARRLRNALRKARSAVIIGAGFLGLEIASTARGMGVDVSIVETASRVLARVVPDAFSAWLQARVAASGATLYLGQSINDLQLPADAVRVSLSDGSLLDADLVVVAVGLTPATDLARSAGLQLNGANGGIEVDTQCRSSDPRIFAAGDCTSQHHEGHGALRLESWQNANEQARIAACAMLDADAPPAAFPWFWTDQFECNIQMLGLPRAGLQYVLRGGMDPADASPKFIMLGLEGSIPRHALAVNAGGDLRALRPVLERGLEVDAAGFSDTSATMKAYAKALLASAVG
ncbi:ferredoxin reductase [Pusillimonas caeni]|uniref:NAD(P)/FAD-dependent oxidoreductase n=1 Tax=Pusillimonas caeni TaxID=1348472 RepID=UPI000E5A0E3E|nr:FAD-dependent oxidoreductase [Pusillimonas caeni]TFL14491.1 ferredoxin reductase [Pusillimonas caeni]